MSVRLLLISLLMALLANAFAEDALTTSPTFSSPEVTEKPSGHSTSTDDGQKSQDEKKREDDQKREDDKKLDSNTGGLLPKPTFEEVKPQGEVKPAANRDPRNESDPELPAASIPSQQPIAPISNDGKLMDQLPSAQWTDPTQPVINEIVLVAETKAESDEQFRQLSQRGFKIRLRKSLPKFQWFLTVFKTPNGMNGLQGEALIRKNWPQWTVEVQKRYELLSSANPKHFGQQQLGFSQPCQMPVTVAMLDSLVDPSVFKRANIQVHNLIKRQVEAHDHGSQIAYLLVGQQSGAWPLLPNAKLHAINIFLNQKDEPKTSIDRIVEGLHVAINQQPIPDFINLSFGGQYSNILEQALIKVSPKSVVVAAAGNGGAKAAPTYPAAYSSVVAVTAVDVKHRPYRQNNQGPYIDLSAPGVDVWVKGQKGKGRFVSGSSFAAPMALAALASLNTTPSNLTQILTTQARDLGEPGKDSTFGYGLIHGKDCQ